MVCAMDPASLRNIDLRAAELSLALYESEYGIQALACLKPRDPEVQALIGGALSDSRKWISGLAATALQAIKPSDPNVLAAIRRADPSFTIDW